MKHLYISLLILVAAVAVLFSSCTDGFEKINTNPYRLTSVDPDYVFGLTTVATLKELSNNNNWFFMGNYTNQLSVIGGGGPHFGKDGRGERYWQNFYVYCLNPLYQFINDPKYNENEGYKNRLMIAKIWRSYVLSQIVALYGPCPCKEACNGEPNIPYDPEDVVYRFILGELKEAYETLNPNGDVFPSGADPFLQSNINRWAQFAHCIRLRVAMRIAEVPETLAPGLANEAREIIAEELENSEQGLLIRDNKDNFFMRFQTDVDANKNPISVEVDQYPKRDTEDPGNFPVIHESFLLWIGPDTYDDPCLNIYATAGSRGTALNPLPEYLGRPHSMETPQNFIYPPGFSSPYSNLKYGDFATLGREFYLVNTSFPFFTYPELVLMKAEAVLKGYWTGRKTAEAYYNDGIDARCARFSISGGPVRQYRETDGIKWSTPSDTIGRQKDFMDYLGLIDSYLGGPEDNFKRIVVQQWINFFIQGVDSYTLLRRTGVLTFKPHFGVDQSTGYTNAYYGYTPFRLGYPGVERVVNAKETQIAINQYLFDNTHKEPIDQITFKLIFCKDVPIISTPQYYLPDMARNRN